MRAAALRHRINFFFSLMNIHCEAKKQHFETHFLSYIDVLWSKCICIGKVGLWNEHTHTHTHPLCIFTRKRENEDYWYVTSQTKDIRWLGAIQPRTSPYTINWGYALNSLFASFSSSYTPPQTEAHPRFPAGPRSPVKFHVCVLIWRWLPKPTHTPYPPHTHMICAPNPDRNVSCYSRL